MEDTVQHLTKKKLWDQSVDNDTAKPNELNEFYKQFEMNTSRECCDVID